MYSVICTIHVLQGFIFPFCGDFSSLQENIGSSKTVQEFLKLAEGINAGN